MNPQPQTDLSHIRRRIYAALKHYAEGDFESCGIHLWPAVDNTAKRRHGGGVGYRIRKFLNASTPMISFIATSRVMIIKSDGQTTYDILYELARNSITHEGQDSPMIEWTSNGSMRIAGKADRDQPHHFPKDFLFGIAMAVVTAPENGSLASPQKEGQLQFAYLPNQTFWLSDLWGGEDYFYAVISAQMKTSVRRLPV